MEKKYIDLLLWINTIKNDPSVPHKYKKDIPNYESFLKSIIEKEEDPKSGYSKKLLASIISLFFDLISSD
nr:hypothetical protein [uncultured Carboxylicivirga sp.]